MGIFIRFAGLLTVGCLAACVSVLPTPEAPAALFRMGPVTSIQIPLSANIIIREPEAPRVLAGQEIAAIDEDGAVRLIEGVEWTDTSTRLLQLALLDTLNTSGEGLAISPGAGAPAPYELDWRVSDLALDGQRARCSLELILLDGRTREPKRRYSVRHEANAASINNTDRALALASASRAAVREAGEWLAREVAGES